MGSFNSSPKINNYDCQDDGFKLPKALNANKLLHHVKQLRGEDQPPLLARNFMKPLLDSDAVSDAAQGLLCLKLNSVAKVCGGPHVSPNCLRLLQWNVLSQSLGENNDGFVCCPKEALMWEYRKYLVIEEILQTNPDIICLQEVDHFKFLQTVLGSQNYDGIFFPKPDSPCLYIEQNNGPDGCAIFYRRDGYELTGFSTRILEVWRVQSNQVVIVANLRNKITLKEFCIATTHLKARQGALLTKLRNEQGRDLLRFVREFAKGRPILLCGDFNAEPNEPVYTTVLNFGTLNLSSAYADLYHEAGNNDDSVGVGDGGGDHDHDRDDTDSNNGRVMNSIKCEPPYTTWKIRESGEVCHTIDYVFYSRDFFKVINCLEFPRGQEMGKNRVPSFQYPSDHFSLVCDFEMLDK